MLVMLFVIGDLSILNVRNTEFATVTRPSANTIWINLDQSGKADKKSGHIQINLESILGNVKFYPCLDIYCRKFLQYYKVVFLEMVYCQTLSKAQLKIHVQLRSSCPYSSSQHCHGNSIGIPYL